MSEGRPVEKGDRFEDRDPRQGERVVRVLKVSRTLVTYEVEVAERNPNTVGQQRSISVKTLLERYSRISR